jgi:L-fucose isomerase-like protein
MPAATLGVIVGNRDFFPDQLVTEARKDILDLLKDMEIEPVILGEKDTKLGGVETYTHAKKCAELFRSHRDKIDGILVVLPNFGDEKGVADTIRLSTLNVPVLIQGYPDDLKQLSVERRRDAFCGKTSVCNDLRQYRIPYTLTSLHVVHPTEESFKQDLTKFVGVCRVVKGLRSARLGAVGARPGNFNTMRFSEKLLEAVGITVVTVDLSEILGTAQRLSDDDARVKERLNAIQSYADASAVPRRSLGLMAKLAVALSEWMAAYELKATAFQCWSSIQQNYGINACTVMSMMSEQMMPSACEVDITGVATMYAMQLASQRPSALVDWNNNYGSDPNKCVFFHCGNWAKSFLPGIKISVAEILATTLGAENTYGAVAGRVPAGPVTYGRISTDDLQGKVRTYVGQGRLTDDTLETFGARAVVEVPKLQKLMHHICKNGFEHHTVMNQTHTADILAEAFETYMGWETYYHERPEA